MLEPWAKFARFFPDDARDEDKSLLKHAWLERQGIRALEEILRSLDVENRATPRDVSVSDISGLATKAPLDEATLEKLTAEVPKVPRSHVASARAAMSESWESFASLFAEDVLEDDEALLKQSWMNSQGLESLEEGFRTMDGVIASPWLLHRCDLEQLSPATQTRVRCFV